MQENDQDVDVVCPSITSDTCVVYRAPYMDDMDVNSGIITANWIQYTNEAC